MRQSRFFLVIFYVFLMLEGLYAQKRVVKQLFSKIDLEPQFELPDGNKIALMGYTELLGQSISIPGPLLEFGEGDSVTLILNNYSQGAPHTIHLHGLDANQANDGVPELSFLIRPAHPHRCRCLWRQPRRQRPGSVGSVSRDAAARHAAAARRLHSRCDP